jgi:peptidylprolyl isomerase
LPHKKHQKVKSKPALITPTPKKPFFKSRLFALVLVVLIVVAAVAVYAFVGMRSPSHDVAIAQVVPSGAVPQGFDIKINITVRNKGTFAETFNATVAMPFNATSTKAYSQKVTSLAAGTDRMLTFTWKTSVLALGDYRVNMTLGSVMNETELADNNFMLNVSLSNKVRLMTSMGNFTIQLYDDMPITTRNFKRLVWSRIYDNTIFHRVVKGFVVQGGDPTGTGYGDPSIPTIQDEFTDHNYNERGTVAMANAGPDTGSSQFFVNLVNNSHLNDKHPVFGEVISGMGVVDQISNVQVDSNSKPLTEVKLIRAEFVK